MFGLFLNAGIWYNIFMKNTEISREKLNQMSQDEVFAFLQQMQSKMDKQVFLIQAIYKGMFLSLTPINHYLTQFYQGKGFFRGMS